MLLIHDLWLHADALSGWTGILAEHGRVAIAPGWPGEQDTVSETWSQVRSGRRPPAGLLDLVDHFAALAGTFAVKPVAIGHGFGGLVAEVLLSRGEVWGAAAIDPAVLRGALPFAWPQLVALASALDAGSSRGRWVRLSQHRFRRLYGSGLTAGDVAASHRRWSIPAPVGPVIDVATDAGHLHAELARPADRPRHHLVVNRRPEPHRAPRAGPVQPQHRRPHVPAVRRVEGRRHSLAVGDGWLDVARPVLAWLDDVDPPRPTTPHRPAAVELPYVRC